MVNSYQTRKQQESCYWQTWFKTLTENLLKPSDSFGVDIDNLGIKTVKAVASNMMLSLPASEIELYADQTKRKHFHMIVYLKQEQPFYLLMASRILAYDDMNRIRSDLVRLACNQIEFVDYLADKKMDIQNNILKFVSNYEKIEVVR